MPERAGHGPRVEGDRYFTTPQLAKLVAERVKAKFAERPRSVLEPGSGAASFLEAARKVWPEARLLGIEVDRGLTDYSRARGFTVEHRDMLASKLADSSERYDLIIGNPPFKFADDFIPFCYSLLAPGGTLAFILRLNILAGQDRYETLWKSLPPAGIFPLPARPGFTKDGKTDATDYAVIAWRKPLSPTETPRPFVFEHLDNRHVVNKWTAEAFPKLEPSEEEEEEHAETEVLREGLEFAKAARTFMED